MKKIDSLGYLFGDEGSGFEMGKNIFIKYKRDDLPQDLSLIFKQMYDKNNDLLEKIYLESHSLFLWWTLCIIERNRMVILLVSR